MSSGAPVVVTESVAASIAAIERALASRPVGLTLREPSPEIAVPDVDVDDDPEPFRRALPHAGPWKCYRDCGAALSTPGLCSKCGDEEAHEEAHEEFRAALDSIPDGFKWARADAPELNARCGYTFDDIGIALSVSGELIPGVVNRILSGASLNVLLRGAPGTGKTSIACAVVREIIDRGIEAWIKFCRRRPGSRTAPTPPEPRIVTLARGARFVSARDLLPPKSRGDDGPPPKVVHAISATILILDDIGQEVPDRTDVYSAAERTQATRDVIAGRWDPGRPIIGTTNMSNNRILGTYSGGTQRRIALAERVKVFEIERRGRR